MKENTNPVVCLKEWEGTSEDGDLAGYDGPGWYFWDETWTGLHGPFGTEQEATAALMAYAESL